MFEKICCFCGHSMLDLAEYSDMAEEIITDLVENHGYNAFFSGHTNDFDVMCEKIVRNLKNKYPHIQLYGILTYDEKNKGSDFDEIIYPKTKKLCEYKSERRAKNRWITERSDLTLCCVNKTYGHAWCMKKHAEKIGREIVNLAE